jgi:hypothetical protein
MILSEAVIEAHGLLNIFMYPPRHFTPLTVSRDRS